MDYLASAASQQELALRPRVCQFKIQLLGISPPVWRQIQVPSDYSLFALHTAIQDAFGWICVKKYRFQKFSRRPEVAYITLPVHQSVPSYEHDCLIRDYFTSEGDTASYGYYFLSRWDFVITFEMSAESVGGDVAYPICVDGRRGRIPENVDTSAIQKILSMANDPNDSRQEEAIGVLATWEYTEVFIPRYVQFRNPIEHFKTSHIPH